METKVKNLSNLAKTWPAVRNMNTKSTKSDLLKFLKFLVIKKNINVKYIYVKLGQKKKKYHYYTSPLSPTPLTKHSITKLRSNASTGTC